MSTCLVFWYGKKRGKDSNGWLSYFISMSGLRFCKKTNRLVESFMSILGLCFMNSMGKKVR